MNPTAHESRLATTTARSSLLSPRPEADDQFTPTAAPPPPAPQPPVEKPRRLLSLDAYRGFIMIVLASGGLGFGEMYRNTASSDWKFPHDQTDHVAWVGCSFWDLIQPSFMFMVGVAVPWSYAARKAKGQSEAVVWVHTLWRSLVLVLLGVFLTSNGKKTTDWAFMNVLTQIGLGYPFICALRGCGWRWQLSAIGAILVGTWLLFFFGPTSAPPPGFDPKSVEMPSDWDKQPSWFVHWEKNTNIAAEFDKWFLNRFPREKPFAFNEGGYQTLNFIPSIATMLLGLIAGERLRKPGPAAKKFLWLAAVGAVCLGLGLLAGWWVCPLVKRIWTPSWVLFSAGWTFLFLAGFFAVIDLGGYRRWAFPLIVVGVNSIAMYLMGQLMKGWVRSTLVTHFAQMFENSWVPVAWLGWAPVARAAAIMVVLWLICLWMYRRGIYLKV